MSVISFDIGIKNLAVIHMIREDDPPLNNPIPVVADSEPQPPPPPRLRIMDWDVLNLVTDGQKVKAQSLDQTTRILYDMLEKRWATWRVAASAGGDKELVVLIENQPAMKNPIMKSIQMLVYGFFAYKNVISGVPLNIRLMSATCKLKLGKDLSLECNTKSKSTYIQNKKKAVAYTDYFLNRVCKSPESWSGVLTDRKKKDDVADCFLQALYFFQSPEAGDLYVDGITEGTPANELSKKKQKQKKKKQEHDTEADVAQIESPKSDGDGNANANANAKAKAKTKAIGKRKYNKNKKAEAAQ
jgi:hypothetical protein